MLERYVEIKFKILSFEVLFKGAYPPERHKKEENSIIFSD